MKKSIIVLVIVVALVVVGAVWAFNTNRAVAPENGVVQNGEVDTSDWQTYRNEELGFEFRYPKEWGEVIVSPVTPIVSMVIGIPGNDQSKIRFNINSAQRTDQQLKNLVYLQVEGDQCEFNLATSKELPNSKFSSIRMEQTQKRLSWEECLTISNTIPNDRKERKVISPHAYTVVYLNDNEVPEVMRKDYQEFKLFIKSFKTI